MVQRHIFVSDVLSDELSNLEKAFENIELEMPSLKYVVNAFKQVCMSKAMVKAKLTERADVQILPPETDRFSDGYPLLTGKMITSLMSPWNETVKSMLLPMATAFPNIAQDIMHLSDVFDQREVDLESCIRALVESKEEDMISTASYFGIKPEVLKFVLGQMLKPFVEKGIETLAPLIENLTWHQGYCPICGSFPELSYLQGNEGQRWLRCSLCGHSWRFDRINCPCCGKRNKHKEFIGVKGVEHHWVELCPDCHRYIVGIDLRTHQDIRLDIAAISLVYLDVIAQQRGFFPAAKCAWNLV
jgi:FdhE protein